MKYEVNHNVEKDRFEVLVSNNIIGVIDYHKEQNVIIVTHTGVMNEYEGQGIAAQLTKALLAYVAANDLKIVAQCSYTKNYIEKHPEYQKLL